MPRAGLTRDDVVRAAADLIDEIGYPALTMGLLAQRLGVRAPSLYKHIDGLADLQHCVATLAMTELGDAIRDAMQGRAGLDALTALLTATRAYVTAHPGVTPPPSVPSSPAPATRCSRPAPASSTRSPRSCADTASARMRWSTPSVPSAPPSTASPSCKPPAAFSGAETRRDLRLDDLLHRPWPASDPAVGRRHAVNGFSVGVEDRTVQVEQGGHVAGLHAAHAALGADAPRP